MQPVWLWILSCKWFEEAFENAQWRKILKNCPVFVIALPVEDILIQLQSGTEIDEVGEEGDEDEGVRDEGVGDEGDGDEEEYFHFLRMGCKSQTRRVKVGLSFALGGQPLWPSGLPNS